MKALEFDLDRGVDCVNASGSYFANTYFVGDGRSARYKQIQLGRTRPPVENPAAVIDRVRKLAGNTLELAGVPLQRMVSVSILRACWNIRHVEGRQTPELGLSVERAASFAIVRSLDDLEAIKPLVASEAPNSRGIGRARRVLAGASDIETLIHMPVTTEEVRSYPVQHAARSAAAHDFFASNPYIAIHGTPGEIEQLVTLDELQVA